MKAYFEKFGEVADCVVMKDSNTNRPRGFGFVKFKEPSCVNMVLAQSAHMLDNKKVSLLVSRMVDPLSFACEVRFHVDTYSLLKWRMHMYGQKLPLGSRLCVAHYDPSPLTD